MPGKKYYAIVYESIRVDDDLIGYIKRKYLDPQVLFKWVGDFDETYNYIVFANERMTKVPVVIRVIVDHKSGFIILKTLFLVSSIPADDLKDLFIDILW